eukprot:358378-Chlamydomonas_euryale.AAC.8
MQPLEHQHVNERRMYAPGRIRFQGPNNPEGPVSASAVALACPPHLAQNGARGAYPLAYPVGYPVAYPLRAL